MSQIAPRVCSQCHSPIEGDPRFCPNCGAALGANGASLTSTPTSMSDDIYSIGGESRTIAPPPPPPPTFPSIQSNQPYTGNPPSYTQYNPSSNYSSSTPDAPTYASSAPSSPNNQAMQNQRGGSFPVQAQPFVPPPAYAQPPKRKRRGGLIFVVLLVLLVIIGSVIFFATRPPSKSNTASNSRLTATTSTSSNTTPTTGTTPSTSGSQGSTTPLSGSLTYAGMDMSFTGAQLASTFADDTSLDATKPGVLRVKFTENNPSTNSIYYSYSEMMRLVLPDGTTIPPVTEKFTSPPASQANQNNWIDFQVPTNLDVSKTVLRLGKTTEAQMSIPLVQNADLSKYKPQSVTPGGTSNYAGIKWTLTKAVRSYSQDGTQVTSGNRYVTVTLSVDNPSANPVYFSPTSVLRLQTGSTKVSPESGYTLPSSYDSGTTNQTGDVTFIVPEGSTSYSLIFQAQDTNAQSSINFQIP